MENLKFTSIATDIDGVVLPLANYQFEKGNKYFNKRGIYIKNPNEYNVRDIYQVSEKERNDFWIRYIWKYSLLLKANDGVSEVINKWQSENREVPVITSRVFVTEENAKGFLFREMLKANLLLNNIKADGIHFCGEETSAKEKADVAEQINITALIDDKTENCKEIADRGKIAFCIENPWNEGFEYENVFRVKDFYEVDQYIKALESGKTVDNLNLRKVKR